MTEEEIAKLRELAVGAKRVSSNAGEVEERSAADTIALLDYAKKNAHRGRQLDRYGFYRTRHTDRN